MLDVARLSAALPAGAVATDPATTAAYAHDEAEWAAYELPTAVVRPQGAADVAVVVRACIETNTPRRRRRRPARGSGRASLVVSAGPGLLAVVDDRRQYRDQRRRDV